MSAPTRPVPGTVQVLIAAKLISTLGSRPLANLSNNEVEDLGDAGETVLMAVLLEQDRRKAAQSTPRSAGHLRLAAVHGELTEAGRRSARARRAARARWSR